MDVRNIHERTLTASPARVGQLLDELSGPEDALWPRDCWPALRLAPRLQEGARGGHGPIRYTVSSYAPGRHIRFRFTVPRGFLGFHQFVVFPGPDATSVLRHTIEMRLRGSARLTWPLMWRWLHDALLEEFLDRAELATGGAVRAPARRSAWVRLLRWCAGARHGGGQGGRVGGPSSRDGSGEASRRRP